MKLAIIDIGSNSVRIGIFANGNIFYRNKESCQLAEGMAFSGKLKIEAMERTLKAIEKFISIALEKGVERKQIFAFATAGVRNSTNGKDFCQMVKSAVNQHIAILSGEEEAKIALLGVLDGDDGVVMDIGGGSTELICADNGKIVYAKSIKIGAVVLTDLYGENRKEIERAVESHLKEFEDFKINKLLAIGGTCSVVGRICANLTEYNRELIHNLIVTKKQVDMLLERLFTLDIEGRQKFLNLKAERAKIICSGVVIFQKIMEKYNLESVQISENDNIEGYFAYLGGKKYEI